MRDYKHVDQNVRRNASLLDFLSHRSRLATENALWVQDDLDLLLAPSDLHPTASHLEPVHPLRFRWLYNNWGYNLAASVIECATHQSWGSYLEESLFEPLGLSRTYTEASVGHTNIGKGYLARRDGAKILVSEPSIANGTLMQGANGVKSCIADLLRFYKALLYAHNAQSESKADDGVILALQDVSTLVTPHISMDDEQTSSQSYGTGWAIAELPAVLGKIGVNDMFIEQMPTAGKGDPKQRLWYHNGSLVGFFSSVHVLPDTDTAIVVLVNSLALDDCADWIGQALLEAVLDTPHQNDHEELARQSSASYNSQWQDLERSFDTRIRAAEHARPLAENT